MQVCVRRGQVLTSRPGKWGEAPGGEGQCDAVHYCQRGSWLGVEQPSWQVHGGQPSTLFDRKTVTAQNLQGL